MRSVQQALSDWGFYFMMAIVIFVAGMVAETFVLNTHPVYMRGYTQGTVDQLKYLEQHNIIKPIKNNCVEFIEGKCIAVKGVK